MIGAFLLLQACASSSELRIAPATEAKIPSRDQVMGPNRARSSVKVKPNKDYLFRNVASAFPDNGKNMLLKDRALPKSSVTGALDHSPRQLRMRHDEERKKKNTSRFSNANKAYYSTPLTQREALVLSQAPKKTDAEEFFYQAEASGRDDVFEPNNTRQAAFDISNAEEIWLALLGPENTTTEGVQADEDWYQIKVSPQYRRLMIDLRYQHYLGDVDMKLYDSAGNLVATSQGVGEDEFIHLILDKGGNYFVQIYGSNRSNRYDLKYSTHFTGGSDDEYEENDSIRSATDLKQIDNQWLSEIAGEAVAADDDYYMLRVPAGRERVQVDFRYDVARGDVDVRLLNSGGKVIASSANIGDDDYIDFTVPHAGIYFLKVYPFSPQTTFNLYDFKVSFLKPSQKEASNNSPKPAK